ncbi:MAG: uroporphyrinogen decarboxylase family protein [Bacteroidales bacterium]|jgi:uroporphyrinogen-III decarboxylase
MKQKRLLLLAILLLASASAVQADLWLKHDRRNDRSYLRECSRRFENVMITGDSPILRTVHDEYITGVISMMREAGDTKGIIWSCGGGMPPDAPTENIRTFITTVRNF